MPARLMMDDFPQPSGGPCSPACAAPPVQQHPQPHAPSAATPANAQHLAFLQGWHAQIAPRLQQLLTMLQSQEVARNLAVAQVWTYLPVLTEGRQLLKAEQLCLLGDAALQQFHAACTQEGVTVSQLGPMGKVWESGAVQVVQYAESLPTDMHPRNRLPGELSRRIGECIYVPLYDVTGQVSQGVLAVVELLIRAHSQDYMVVANAISCLTSLMEPLQLSLSNPRQQAQAQQQAQQAQQQQQASPPQAAPQRRDACGGASSSGGSGGALARTVSMASLR